MDQNFCFYVILCEQNQQGTNPLLKKQRWSIIKWEGHCSGCCKWQVVKFICQNEQVIQPYLKNTALVTGGSVLQAAIGR